MTRACSIDGCGKPARARGMCQTHYGRWKRNGHTDLITDYRGARRLPPVGTLTVECPRCGVVCGIVTSREAVWAVIRNHRCQAADR